MDVGFAIQTGIDAVIEISDITLIMGDLMRRTTKWKTEDRGKTYYFCAPDCKAKFLK